MINNGRDIIEFCETDENINGNINIQNSKKYNNSKTNKNDVIIINNGIEKMNLTNINQELNPGINKLNLNENKNFNNDSQKTIEKKGKKIVEKRDWASNEESDSVINIISILV